METTILPARVSFSIDIEARSLFSRTPPACFSANSGALWARADVSDVAILSSANVLTQYVKTVERMHYHG
jgi:hypothetical protein